MDIGGTFTDLVMLDPGRGRLLNEKVLTTPDDPSRGVLAGIALILAQGGVAPGAVDQVIHGTTLVANALIERKGVRTALVTTAGFRDVLEIGREWRFDTYDLMIQPPAPLVPRPLRLEVTERIGPEGEVVVPLDPGSVEAAAVAIAAGGAEAVAVCLLHAFRNGAHEAAVKRLLQERLPGLTVCTSAEVMPEIGEFERTVTAVANAYVQPVFSRYIARLGAGLRAMGVARDVVLMLSDGGTVDGETARAFPIRLVQSGPAGGAQAAALFGRRAGAPDLLCFDMGGTTAKACLVVDGEPARARDFEVARTTRFKKGSGMPLKVPVIDMIEIGAGGGSIARVDRLGLIQVGPDSASAVPGPACYGAGGAEATVTDADLVLGFLAEGSFLGGDMRLDAAAARAAIRRRVAEPLGLDVVEAAWGIHQTVNEAMSQAAALHVLEKGRRPSDFAMLPIGGAGPVHACDVARRTGIGRVICPPGAGVASAFGFLAAPMAFELVQAGIELLAELDVGALRATLDRLERQGRELLRRAGVAEGTASVALGCAMRYVGQGFEVDVPVERAGLAAPGVLAEGFHAAYHALYGRAERHMPIETVSWRVVVSGPRPVLDPGAGPGPVDADGDAGAALTGRRPVFDGVARRFTEAAVYGRALLLPGMQLQGPAIVEERESTLVVPVGATLRCDAHLNLVVAL